MPSPTICQVAIPSPLRRIFDYLIPEKMPVPQAGCRVVVPFGRRVVTGIVVTCGAESALPPDSLKPVSEVLDDKPLIPEYLFQFYLWAAQYYQHPLGDALSSMLPIALRSGEILQPPGETRWRLSTLGKGLPETALSRAPRQQQLLQLLQQQGSVSKTMLDEQGIQTSIVRELEKKSLIETFHKPVEKGLPADVSLLVEKPLELNAEQQAALDSVTPGKFQCTLLQGETGSGKTEVYLQLIEKIIERGQQAIVLVPEINLTPQTLARFSQRFNCTIAAMHSGLTDRERLQAWQLAREGLASIVIGTRSAIFTPLANPGVIIVDEEHDASFKQQEGFHYSARDLAVVRAKTENIPVVLGSATPSLESMYNCQRGRYSKQVLHQRHGNAHPVRWELVDPGAYDLQGGFSEPLIRQIRHTLQQGSQVLVFINRRGYAPRLSCQNCLWLADCDRCSARYTVHQKVRRLICHHCEKTLPIPRQCPQCGSEKLTLSGHGTQRSEETLAALFPEFPVVRIDRDSTRRKHRMTELVADISKGDPCILVGTQMLAKGHHFPNITLVVMLDMDNGLFSPDFRAAEKMGQMITQVAGRCGRGDRQGRVLIQSQYCDHPWLTRLSQEGYVTFARYLLEERLALGLPPYRHLTIIRAEAANPEQGEKFLQRCRDALQKQMNNVLDLTCIGPLPAALERKKGRFRYQLSFLSADRRAVQKALSKLAPEFESQPLAHKVKWSLDVDPLESM